MIPRHLQIAMAVLLVAALGLSMYAWHIRKSAAATPAVRVDTRPLAPPATGPMEKVLLYVAHDEDGTLRAQDAQIPMPSGRQQRAEELARALISLYLDKSSPHAIGSGAEDDIQQRLLDRRADQDLQLREFKRHLGRRFDPHRVVARSRTAGGHINGHSVWVDRDDSTNQIARFARGDGEFERGRIIERGIG